MEVLITGATGFIGSVLARRCADIGHNVTALGQTNNDWESRHAENLQRIGIEVLVGSILDESVLKAACSGKDAVIHLAAAQHESKASMDFFHDVNVNGTRNVLEASVRAGVNRFVQGSTIGVYGCASGQPLNEDSPLRPDNVYGKTKLEGERVARAYSDKIGVSIARISETYGPEDKRLLTLFRGIDKGWFPLVGSGKNRHQPIFVNDLADSLIDIASGDATVGEIINLAGPAPVSTIDMIHDVEHAAGHDSHIVHVPMMPFIGAAILMEKLFPPLGLTPPLTQRRLDFFRKEFWFDTSKSLRLLGNGAKTDFELGAMATMEWYKSNGLIAEHGHR